ncbi:MAG: cupin domain-containing protein [Candidatus Caldarchaeum sp.]|nr:cupin domain-containing protein [Candidatus Caldarchaeum sp.]MCS7136864.1 cupin domain-containing protein [Candidatus Caldarchaeum sp.]MDW7977616.1 cupin domain-containing protein [Candidatus Caldarchaeum sp.]MDW8360248.1 cupin domain-containing protein [Candidatus Caldarchaeum sp.]
MGFKHVRWENIPWEKLRDDVWRRAVFGEKMTVAQLRLLKGAKVAMHSHIHEQTAYVVEGKVKFVFEDRLEQVVEGGGVIVIPSNLGHAAEALEDSLVVDVFAPPREDWIKGDDSYLRKPV